MGHVCEVGEVLEVHRISCCMSVWLVNSTLSCQWDRKELYIYASSLCVCLMVQTDGSLYLWAQTPTMKANNPTFESIYSELTESQAKNKKSSLLSTSHPVLIKVREGQWAGFPSGFPAVWFLVQFKNLTLVQITLLLSVFVHCGLIPDQIIQKTTLYLLDVSPNSP